MQTSILQDVGEKQKRHEDICSSNYHCCSGGNRIHPNLTQRAPTCVYWLMVVVWQCHGMRAILCTICVSAHSWAQVVILTISGYKRGIGKTMTAVHLAACLQQTRRQLQPVARPAENCPQSS